MLTVVLLYRITVQSSVEPAQILQSVLRLHPHQNQPAQTAHREGAQGIFLVLFLIAEKHFETL